jgi:hypothetical protein
MLVVDAEGATSWSCPPVPLSNPLGRLGVRDETAVHAEADVSSVVVNVDVGGALCASGGVSPGGESLMMDKRSKD